MNLETSAVLILIIVTSVLTHRQRRQRGSKYIDIAYGHPSLKQCECGRENVDSFKGSELNRIINGEGVAIHQYPWIVAILFKGEPKCGGSIISDMYILTAAHCTLPDVSQDDMKILVGDHNLCVSDSDNAILSVSRIIKHPKYSEKNYHADIMLLRTNMRITFNRLIRPICIPNYEYHYKDVPSRYGNLNGTTVGWGVTNTTLGENEEPQLSCILKKLIVPVFKKEDCTLTKVPTLFCAGYLNGEGDACQGDSGGPLQYQNAQNGRYEVIGIVSNGIGCAERGSPGLYTDVVQYIPWIWKQIAFDSRTCW